MVDYIGLLIPYIPGILLGLVPFGVWVGNRIYPTKEEKLSEFEMINQANKEQREYWERMFKETNAELNKLKEDMIKLNTKVNTLMTCKKRYYQVLDYLIKLFDISEKEGFNNKLPDLDSKIKKDMEKRK